MFKRNQILDRDNYKLTHWMQLNPLYQWFSSYMESRKGAKNPFVYVLLSYLIKKNYSTVPTKEDIDVAEQVVTRANGANYFNREVWEKVNELGYWPMKIKGLPEGTKAPTGTPLFTIEPTEEWFAKTLNGEETKLMRSWFPMAVLTRLMILKTKLTPIFEKAGCLDQLEFCINGFEARSATSDETSDLAGMASLFAIRGSDNLHGQNMINYYYQGGEDRLKTVWATEHACALSYGPGEGEFEYFKAQLKSHTSKIKSIVVDTYYDKNFLDNVITRKDCRKLIEAHKGTIVLRKDSGNFNDDLRYYFESISKNFGFTEKDGYKVLNKFAIMQSDGVNPGSIINLYDYVVNELGYYPTNLVVGGGTGLMFDGLTRDYNRNAIKPSINKIGGKFVNVNKVVKSDPSKGSKPGILKVDKNLVTHSSADYTKEEFESIECIMVDYYNNGEILSNSFDDVMSEINK